MDYLFDLTQHPSRPRLSRASRLAWVVSTLLLACDPSEGTTGPAASETGGSATAGATGSTTEPENATGVSDLPGCECISPSEIPQITCDQDAAACGTYFQDETECDVNDGDTGAYDPNPAQVEANAMVVQCILDNVAAGERYRFGRYENPGASNNCETIYAASPDGLLRIIDTHQRDLCFDSVASIRSGFDPSGCQGMTGEDGWACIQAAVASATLDGICVEREHCEG